LGERYLSLLDEYVRKEQANYMLDRIDSLPQSGHIPPLVDWAEEKRFLPSGTTEVPGKFSRKTVPHLIEPLEMLHPDNPITHVAMMKSVQSANTTSILENATGAWLDYQVGSCLFLTSTKGIGNIRSSSAIDVMIDNAGLKIKPMSQRMKRKTGDKANYKEFAGNLKLLISSYNSIADLKSNTFHFIGCDEWDEAGAELKGQGDIAGIIDGRTLGLRRYKVLYISTPSNMETSRIYKAFLEGDQRKFNLPCPICGEKQIPILKGKGVDYGLTFTREKHKQTGNKILVPESVRYTCQHCKKDFYESKKQWMLENGVWIPTAVPEDRKRVSYHSPGFISPFLGWERICQQFINTGFGDDLLKFKDFTINYLGLPWAGIKKTKSWELLRDRAENYTYGEVPEVESKIIDGIERYDGGLVLCGGIDVQGDRIELHVVAFGKGMQSWSVDYRIFYGDTSNIDDPCWIALDEHVYSKTYRICGVEQLISMCAIDSGFDPKFMRRDKDYAEKSHVVYDFVSERQDKFIAIMGSDDTKMLSLIKETRVQTHYRLTKRYNVAVSLAKEIIMSNIDKLGGSRAIHFPKNMLVDGIKTLVPDQHFKQFLSERYQEISPGKYGWEKIFQRNEVLDTFIYARAAAEYRNIQTWTSDVWDSYYYTIKNMDN
jgi:phage terminase large subunit GpA-like protein